MSKNLKDGMRFLAQMALICVCTSVPSRAFAIPALQYQTGLPCMTCHTAYPSLSFFGR